MSQFDKTSMHDLTTGSIPRHLIRFSLPMLAGNLLQVSYGIINTFWVGNYLGKNALTAATNGFTVLFLLVGVGFGLTLATNILISQYCGAKEWPRVKQVVQCSTTFIGGLSFILMGVGIWIAPALLRMMQTPPEAMGMAESYLRLCFLTLPCGFGFFLISSMLRGAGDSLTPLKFMAISVVMTALFDPFLMLGWAGFPHMGLNGTAVSSFGAQAVALIALLIYLQRRRHLVAPDLRHLTLDWETTWLTLKIGMPSVVQQSLVSIGSLFVITFVNGFGVTAAAAFGAASRFDQIAFFPAMTIGVAVSTLTGQNIGANKHARVNEVFRWGLLLGCSITLLVSLLAVTVPQLLLRIFTNDQSVITTGINYLHIVGAFYVFFAVLFVSNGVINGSGHTLMTTLISLVSLWVVRVPLAWTFSHHMHRVEGVWYAMAISYVVSMLISVGYYYSGSWRKSVIMHTPPAAVCESETAVDIPPPAGEPSFDICIEPE